MQGRTRTLIAAIASLSLMGSAAAAEAPLDTAKLPRVAVGKEIYASAATTIYTARDPVAATAEAIVKAIVAQGWQSYVPPFTEIAGNPNVELRYFKKGPQALNVNVSLAPAQGNATSVQYNALVLANDLPFPKDATHIAFAPDRPYLSCLTAGSLDATMAFFASELVRLGWARDPAATVEDRYIRAGHGPLTLILRREDDGAIKVVLDGLGLTAGMVETTTKKRIADSAADATAKASKDAADEKFDNAFKDAKQMVDDAIAEVAAGGKSKPKLADQEAVTDGIDKPVTALANNTAPIPLPELTNAMDFKPEDGTLSFSASTSVKAMVAFFRRQMTPVGWTEHKSVINRANMVLLKFSKTDKDVNITIMQHGDIVSVSANGSALQTAAPSEVSSDNKSSHSVSTNLEASESTGLPMPRDTTFVLRDSAPFRAALNVRLAAPIDAVLAFYQRELAKRDWQDNGGTLVERDRTVAFFTAPEGPAKLELERQNGETTVTLAVRHTADAKTSGLLAKAGQAKILLANTLDSQAAVTINKRTFKIAAGAGTKAPDGPSLELAPGKYKYTIKGSGQPSKSGEITVAADDIWGLMVGPGGMLALQMY